MFDLWLFGLLFMAIIGGVSFWLGYSTGRLDAEKERAAEMKE